MDFIGEEQYMDIVWLMAGVAFLLGSLWLVHCFDSPIKED